MKGGTIVAIKTANVLARVEPDIKEKAESIMAKLGVPASVVINMLYKQIVMTKSIPFSLSLPAAPLALDEMDAAAFDAIMQKGLDEARADRSRPASEVFKELRRGL
ncbi:MAG TPA: type II toxin-antitoxin system RelB/DinJ family antitoxin [Methylomusa anaerophila]|nr:type II toxin-antitoxin system RelB/DinJ family antitoxin [Methylomusa anaerophila]